jgi:hypothetical protein
MRADVLVYDAGIASKQTSSKIAGLVVHGTAERTAGLVLRASAAAPAVCSRRMGEHKTKPADHPSEGASGQGGSGRQEPTGNGPACK